LRADDAQVGHQVTVKLDPFISSPVDARTVFPLYICIWTLLNGGLPVPHFLEQA
jgi:hypothetical protein